MSESFDPYRKWLGIPPQDQPPHHYRLLGIELFESDPDVISNASDGRMAQVKNFQAGKYSGHSQRILNEIAVAKVCLLNPARKIEYDRQLKERLPSDHVAPKTAPPAAKESSAAAEGSVEMEMPGFRPVPASSYLPRPGRKGSRWQIPGVLAVLSVLVIVLLAVWPRDNRGTTVADRTKSSSLPPSESPNGVAHPAKPPEPVKPKPSEPAKKPVEPVVNPSEKRPAVEVGREQPALPEVKSKKPSEESQNPAGAGGLPDGRPPGRGTTAEPATPSPAEPPTTPAGPKKLAVPDSDQQQVAEAKVREIFAKEFAAAKTADQKLHLAAKLFKQGETTADDSAARFVLLRMACEMAAAAGALNESLGAVDKMQQDFDVDAVAMKTDLLARSVESGRIGGRKTADSQEVVGAAMALLDDAVAVDDFESAGRLGKLATTAARAAKDPQIVRNVIARIREVDRLKLHFASVKKAIDVLAENPDDAQANATVGQWHCFSKDDWEKGLPLLRKGGDEKLAGLATRDLASPADSKAQAALGDDWWELAEAEQGPVKSVFHTRAAHWYEQALPKLSGLEKTKVERRLETIAAASGVEKQPAAASKVRGIVEPGNVALASNGTTVTGGAQSLLDGNSTNYDAGTGFTHSLWPCEWTITFRKVYRLQAICFLLHDLDKSRFYRYRIQVSADGKKFTDLADRSQGQWRGWQQLVFPPRQVKAVKLIGLFNSANPSFHVLEFEAYCIPPQKSSK
jgi:hypothetical protein